MHKSSNLKIVNLGRIKNFPVSFLSVSLGLMGFTLAWQKAETIFKLPFSLSNYFLFFTIGITLIIISIYFFKLALYPNEVKKEFNHPIKLNFFPILAKLFLICSIIFLALNMPFSYYLWWIGVILQSVFTIIIMSSWIQHDKFSIHHINPSWFIPVVGAIIIPIAGVEHFSKELSWFFFSIGFFWWLILTVLIINRMIFHNPIPNKLIPTLFILFAPPVIGFIALTKLLGGLNTFGNLLFYFGGFLFVLIIFQYNLFKKLKFYLSWWAYSFPLDALMIGLLLMYHETLSGFYYIVSWFMFVVLNLTILSLIIKTISSIFKKQICIEEID